MGATVVSLLHVAPKSNRELMQRMTSEALAINGSDIHASWARLVRSDRFRGVALEDLVPLVAASVPDPLRGTILKGATGE